MTDDHRPDGGRGPDDPEDAGKAARRALALDEIHENAGGRDSQNLEDEFLVFENHGDARIALTGWTVSNDAGESYSFPDGVTLGPGDRLTLRSGSGRDAGDELYWDAARPVWPNAGGTVLVRDDEGRRVLRESY
jgi:competence protein ComEC